MRASLKDIMLKSIYSPQNSNNTNCAIVEPLQSPSIIAGMAINPPNVPIKAKTAAACIPCFFISGFEYASHPGKSKPKPMNVGIRAVMDDWDAEM